MRARTVTTRVPAGLDERVVDTGRENTLLELELALAGLLRVPGSIELHDRFVSLSPDAQAFIRELLVKAVDATVYNTLRAIDDTEGISIIADPEERDDDLRVLTDGLAGSFIDPDHGWLKRHGVRPRSVFDAWMEQPIDTSWMDRLPRGDQEEGGQQ